MSGRTVARGAGLLLAGGLAVVLAVGTARDAHFWRTPDQQGDALLRAGRYDEAAAAYRDPFRQGVALYRAGKFQEAAAALARSNSPGATFDRGNAFLLLGKY